MELLVSLGIGALVATGIYLVLRERSFSVVLGLTLLSYAANLFIFAAGRLSAEAPPLVLDEVAAAGALPADPLPQALVLTAIVISFAMTALFLVVLLASRGLTGTDHVDGREPKE